MMKPDEVMLSASGLRDFSRVGLPIDEVCGLMERIMPKHAPTWKSIRLQVAKGRPLSEQLAKARIWPAPLCAAVSAGELSNNLDDTYTSIREFVRDQQGITRNIRNQILPNIGFILAGLVIFVGFMVGLIPEVAKDVRPDQRTGFIAISDFLVSLDQDHLVLVSGALLATVTGGYMALKNPGVRLELAALLDGLPGLGPGLRSVYFGFWARFMVLLDRAGDIDYPEMARIASLIMPMQYQDGLRRYYQEVRSPMGMATACEVRHMNRQDPRRKWPDRLMVGLQMAAQTGRTDAALGAMSQALIEDGQSQIDEFAKIFGLFCKALAALAIVMPMLALMIINSKMIGSI
jgi:type II secretory pathway component PulF